MTVLVKLEHPSAKMPVQLHGDDACLDVYAAEIVRDGGKVTVDLGFATAFSNKYVGRIVPRSNLTKHSWVIGNSPAIIDSGYRGTWKIVYRAIPVIGAKGNVFYEDFPYDVGDRVAQIFFDKVRIPRMIQATNLSYSSRGTGGFGSTGLI